MGPVELGTDAVGDPADPAVLLVAGNGSSMDWWEDDFCAQLAAAGRYVLRYDHRDTGESTHWPAGSPGYRSEDLVTDAVAVLDAYGVGRACLVGMSMGGALAQLIALDRPDRVGALVLVATTASGHPDGLPPTDPALQEWFATTPEPDWADRAAVVEYLVSFDRALSARSVPHDDAHTRALATRALARTADPAASLTNHSVLDGGPDGWWDRLGELRVPTLVVHGEEDPLFPGHGAPLATAIPGARLLSLPGVGHELPRRAWPAVLPAIAALSP